MSSKVQKDATNLLLCVIFTLEYSIWRSIDSQSQYFVYTRCKEIWLIKRLLSIKVDPKNRGSVLASDRAKLTELPLVFFLS